MLWWESVAPLGKPVVPLVYWMLIASSALSVSPRSRTRPTSPSWTNSAAHCSVSVMTTRSSPGVFGRTVSIISAYCEVLKLRAATSSRIPAWLSTNSSSWVR